MLKHLGRSACLLGASLVLSGRPVLGAEPPSASPPSPVITVVAGGDLLFDRGVRRRAESIGVPALLHELRPFLTAANLALANLECPLTREIAPKPKAFVFRCDPEVAPRLRQVGFSALSLANNHSIDQGRQGILDTIAALQQAGIVPLGAGRAQTEARRARMVEVGGLRLALFAYVAMPIEGVMYLEDQPAAAQLEEEAALADVAASRARADLVIVTIHWGIEFRSQASPEQRRLGHLFVDNGATLVLGHHPHVLQPVERYRQGVIAYSLGNLVFDQRRRDGKDTALLRCSLSRARAPSCAAIPLEIERACPRPASSQARRRIAAALQLPLADGVGP
jgi:poly-gamma-glutamate capsule biosynthesis protein CapA/YwtB (metallophosphatase superfamily)